MFVKADLIKYKGYTILFNAHEIESGCFCPVAILFKSGEKAATLDIKRTFAERSQALSFALSFAEATVDAKPKEKKPYYAWLISEC